MATQIKTWQIIDGKLTPIESDITSAKKKEYEDLEAWIKSSPDILGSDIAIVGEQVATRSGVLDFFGIDGSGNAVIIELKRDKLPREVLGQAMDYASDVAQWGVDQFREICSIYADQALEDYLQEKLEQTEIEELQVNQAQRLLLVGFSIEEPLSRMIEWLSSAYNVPVNAILLNYVRTQNGEDLLSRTVVISEDVEKEKIKKKKYVIEMSDDPGAYDADDLIKHLRDYLRKNLYSSRRIRDHFLPILLEKGTATRDQLRTDFVKRKAADDESQAGYFL